MIEEMTDEEYKYFSETDKGQRELAEAVISVQGLSSPEEHQLQVEIFIAQMKIANLASMIAKSLEN
jgi:hypothetical protein